MWDRSNAAKSKKSLVCAMSPALQFSVKQPAGFYDMCVLKYYGFPLACDQALPLKMARSRNKRAW